MADASIDVDPSDDAVGVVVEAPSEENEQTPCQPACPSWLPRGAVLTVETALGDLELVADEDQRLQVNRPTDVGGESQVNAVPALDGKRAYVSTPILEIEVTASDLLDELDPEEEEGDPCRPHCDLMVDW